MSWQDRLSGCGLARVVHLRRCVSTQTAARRLAEKGVPAWTLVIADCQTRGRGRMSNGWSSGRGGLYFSLVLRPDIAPERLASLSMPSAEACARAIAEASGLKVFVKPPNDVFALSEHASAHKVCGVLIEARGGMRRVDWVVIGIGVNVNNRLPGSLPDAASIRSLTGRRHELSAILKAILRALSANLPT